MNISTTYSNNNIYLNGYADNKGNKPDPVAPWFCDLKTDPSTPMLFTAEQVEYLNEKNLTSEMVYADFLLLDAATINDLRGGAYRERHSIFEAASSITIPTDYSVLNTDPTIDGAHFPVYRDGSATLTPEQIEYLENRYDFKNMSWNEYKKYLADLCYFNVISTKECFELTIRKEANIALKANIIGWNGPNTDIPEGIFSLYDYLLKEHSDALMFEKVNKTYNYYDDAFLSSAYAKLIRLNDLLTLP